MEMEKFKHQAEEKDQGAIALVLDLAKAFRRVSLPVVWAWATSSASQERSCRCYAGTSGTRGSEEGKEGKSEMIASSGYLEDELRQCSKAEGVTMADSVEALETGKINLLEEVSNEARA